MKHWTSTVTPAVRDRGIDLIRTMERFGEIIAGTEREAEAAEFLAGHLRQLGLLTEIHEFPAIVSEPGDGQLMVLGDGRDVAETVRCQVFAQSEPTPPGGLEAEAVYVGNGGGADYPADSVAGKIVLAELSYDPPRPEKARIARVRGAAALVLINWGSDDNSSVPKGTVKCVWGNPTRREEPDIRTLPAVGVPRGEGTGLLAAARRGVLRLRLETSVVRAWRVVRLPIGWLRRDDAVAAGAGEFVLLGGHYDSWGGGVTDNHSGNVGSLLVVEALAEQRERLRRDVAVAFWPAHESGIMCGSTWFADQFWPELRDNCVSFLNIDGLGMVGTTVWEVEATAELRALVERTAAAGPLRPLRYRGRPLKYGDQSFFGAGVPSLVARSGADPSEVATDHGATLGWWYHSDNDTIDKLDPEAFAHDVGVFIQYAAGLAESAVLPLRGEPVAREICDRLDALDRHLRERGFDANSVGIRYRALQLAAEELLDVCHTLDAALDGLMSVPCTDGDPRVEEANSWLRDLARLTIPVRYSCVNRYAQDYYCAAALGEVLPGLAVLDELASATGDSRHILWTEAVRAHNRLSDALDAAARRGRQALAVLVP